MTYSEFANQKPVLYGQITVNGKSKIGSFRPTWWSLTNSLGYTYHSPSGNKGQGGFTLQKAHNLLMSGRLTTNPDDGNPSNYL